MELKDKTNKVKTMIETLIKKAVNPKWQFSGSGVVALKLQQGLEQLPGVFGMAGLDDSRIVDYIVYQVYRNRDWIEQGKWEVNNMFSPNSQAKYKHQFMSAEGKAGINYYINQWLEDCDLTREMLAAIIAPPKQNRLKDMIYQESEELIKMRWHNTDEGFALCQQSTTGWSPLSKACKECKNWVECGKQTKERFPELMRLRKEAYYGK